MSTRKRLTCEVGSCRNPAISATLQKCEFHAYSAVMGTERASVQAQAAQVERDRKKSARKAAT